MSGKTPQSAAKSTIECPHCGFKQLESPFAKSTFCRKCSEHFDIGKTPPRQEEERLSFFDRVGELFGRKKTRDISCFKCGAAQTISNSAKSSLCPHCSTYLDLTDFKIKTAYSRSIETQGMVHITSKGDVTSATIACGEAYVYGKLRGNLMCSGETHLKLKGKFNGSLDVNKLIIERRSDIEALRPIKARSVEVAGKISGRFQVNGTLTITKKGWLEGSVVAKGINIEKGGVFFGDLTIGHGEMAQPDLIPEEEEPLSDVAQIEEPSLEEPVLVDTTDEDEEGEEESSGNSSGAARRKDPPGNGERLNFGLG